MSTRCIVRSVAVAVCLLAACSRSGGEKQMESLLDKKDITRKVQEGDAPLSQIQPEAVPGDLAQMQLLLSMGMDEYAARLGSFTFSMDLRYTTASAAKTVEMAETHVVRQSDNGDFHVRMGNDKQLGYELFWVDRAMYQRTQGGAFHKEESTGKHRFWREKAGRSIDRFNRYFEGNLRFEDAGSEMLDGRRVKVITVAQGTTVPARENAAVKIPTQKPARDMYSINRRAFEKMIEKARSRINSYQNISGTLYFDPQAGCLVRGVLDGEYVMSVGHREAQRKTSAPDAKPDGVAAAAGPDGAAASEATGGGTGSVDETVPVTFGIHLKFEFSGIGRPVALQAPEHEPPMKRDRVDNDRLKFLDGKIEVERPAPPPSPSGAPATGQPQPGVVAPPPPPAAPSGGQP